MQASVLPGAIHFTYSTCETSLETNNPKTDDKLVDAIYIYVFRLS